MPSFSLRPDRADVEKFVRDRAAAFSRTPDFAAFFEQLDEREGARFAALFAAARALSEGDQEGAAAAAEITLRDMPDDDDDSGSVPVRTFAEALLGRIRSVAGGGNLYLDARPPGAQLRAFELLRLRTPLIPFGYAAGNRALSDALSEPEDVTILDVGIGRGGQLRALLKNPAARRSFRSLHVIGVEPDTASSTRSGALEMAERNVLSAGDEVGVPTTFAGIAKRAEDLTLDDIAAAGPRGVLLCNCTLALHHTLGDALDGRDRVLTLLREAGARSIVLVEPDSDHFRDDLAERFLFAYRHYRTLWRSLKAMLSLSDATLVWSEFFAPEVHNVVCYEGELRTERHEEATRWAERLEAAGWRVETLRGVIPQAAAPDGFVVRGRGPAFALSYAGVSLLGVLRASAG